MEHTEAILVRIVYDVFRGKSIITIQDKPLNKFSKLSKFQSLPFEYWRMDIFDAISQEVNDDYKIDFYAFPYEQEIFLFYADKYMRQEKRKDIPICFFPYEVNDSIFLRLKKLNLLSSSGLFIDRMDETIPIFTDKFASSIKSITPLKLIFCKFDFVVRQLILLNACERTKIIITDSDMSQNDNTYTILIGENNGYQGNNRYDCSLDALDGIMEKILNGVFYKNLLLKTFERIEISNESLHYNSLEALKIISPKVVIDISKNIGVGELKTIWLQTIPEGGELPDIEVKITPENVVTWKDQKLLGKIAGECVIDVFDKASRQFIDRKMIRVYERNPVTQLTFVQKDITLSQDVYHQLAINYEPTSADNLPRTIFVSSNEAIVKVDGRTGGIYTVNPGTATVKVECEGVSDSCEITVTAKLTDIDISFAESGIPKVNTIRRVNITPVPTNAALSNLTVAITPDNVAAYDYFTSSLKLNKKGKCSLLVTNTEDSVINPLSVERVFEFEIKD